MGVAKMWVGGGRGGSRDAGAGPAPADAGFFVFPDAVRRALSPDDRFVVSYPRSGNTWVRFVLAACCLLRAGREIPETDAGIASIYDAAAAAFPDIHQGLPTPPPPYAAAAHRILKSHNVRELAGRKAVYLFRKPADALVSYAKFASRPSDAFAGRQVMTWAAEAEAAAAFAEQGDFLPVSYEGLLADPESKVRAIAAHLGMEFDAEEVAGAVALNRFERWKAYERAGRRAPEGAAKRLGQQGGTFFSSGRAGAGGEELSARTRGWIEEFADPLYRKLAAMENPV